MSTNLQPDVSVWQYAGTEIYATFNGTGSNSYMQVTWDYNAGTQLQNLDMVYVLNGTGNGQWEFAASRYNDQSHHAELTIPPYTITAIGLQQRAGGGSTETGVSQLLVRYHYVTSLAARINGLNIETEWELNSNVPPSLTGFFLMASVDSGAYYALGSFDANETSSTVGKPAFSSTLDLYLVGHDAGENPITFPTAVVSLTP